MPKALPSVQDALDVTAADVAEAAEAAAQAPEPEPEIKDDVSVPAAGDKAFDPAHWPAAQMELRPTGTLIAYGGNARKHTERQINQITESIREWGWTFPILIDESGLVIAGHGRLAAAKKLNLAKVPVMIARGWSASQKRAYVLADNQLALNSEWDEDLLADEMRELAADDFDLDVLGFEPEQLADMVKDVEPIKFGKGESNPSMTKVIQIRWSNRVLPLDTSEADELDKRYSAYVAKYGSAAGFVKSLINAL